MMEETNEVRMGRYLSGEAGGNEQEAFEKEVASNPALKEEFLIYKKIWDSAPLNTSDRWDSEQAWQKFANANQTEVGENVKIRKINLKWLVAAAIILALGSFFLFWNQGKPMTYVYNEKNSDPVSLSDGSKIYLNKGASIKVYPFNHKNRHVSLKGEALFEVSPDPKRPFTVESGGTMTEVVGTSFNITQTPDHTRIFVLKGKVIFKSIENEQAAVALTIGEAAVFEGNRMQMIPNPSPNISAWHSKQLRFIKMPLEQVITDVSAYFNQEISVENEAVKQCPITIPLTFKEPELSAVLKAIAISINGELKIEGNRYIIVGGRCS